MKNEAIYLCPSKKATCNNVGVESPLMIVDMSKAKVIYSMNYLLFKDWRTLTMYREPDLTYPEQTFLFVDEVCTTINDANLNPGS